MPAGVAYHQVQQALSKSWSKYNPDYGTNGWFESTENYETDKIAMPVRNFYVEDDSVCENTCNKALGDTIPTQSFRVTFLDRTHFEDKTMMGNNDLDLFTLLLTKLGGKADDLEGDCATLTFGDWV